MVAQRVDNLDRGQMRTLVDNMRNKLGSGVVVLGSVQDGKVALIVGVTADLTSRVQAGKVIKQVAEKVGGSGGGRPDMAEAGGKDPAQLDAALNEAYAAVEGLLDSRSRINFTIALNQNTPTAAYWPPFFAEVVDIFFNANKRCWARAKLDVGASVWALSTRAYIACAASGSP